MVSRTNERVFFWLYRDRLYTLMSAAEYAGKKHAILQVDSASLVRRHEARIELAHMNTGTLAPFLIREALRRFGL